MANFEDIKGKTLKAFETDNENHITFEFTDETKYKMYHDQDCCESVIIEDVNGNIEDLIGDEILVAEERYNSGETDWGTCTWTFYTIRTVNTSIDIRWNGESNGYYSEGVDFAKANKEGFFDQWDNNWQPLPEPPK